MLRELERVAPGSSRKRSRFIRLALQKALMDLQDLATRKAYARMPDDGPDWFDERVWDEWKPRGSKPRETRRGKVRRRAKA